MSLLSLAGDRGALFGFTSTFRLAFLGACFWYWRSPGAPSVGLFQILALSVALSRPVMSRAVALLYGAPPTKSGLSPQLSSSGTSTFVPRSSALLHSYWKLYSRKPKMSKITKTTISRSKLWLQKPSTGPLLIV